MCQRRRSWRLDEPHQSLPESGHRYEHFGRDAGKTRRGSAGDLAWRDRLQLGQRCLVRHRHVRSGRVEPSGELDNFPDVAPDRNTSVAMASEPGNELIEIGAGAPGLIPRNGVGVVYWHTFRSDILYGYIPDFGQALPLFSPFVMQQAQFALPEQIAACPSR
jgi:hypothetical protein